MTSKENTKTSHRYAARIAKIMAVTLIGKVMGILRDRMQGVYFGTYSPEGIAFTQASLLPRVFLDIMFASALSASFIPVFNLYLETKGKEAAFELAASFIKIVLLITTIVTLAAIIFAGPLYSFFLGGDLTRNPEAAFLGVRLLRMMFPIMIITSLAFSFTGILQSLGQFYIPAAMSIASNGIILLYYFFLIDYFGVYGLAAAFLTGWSFQVLIQAPFLIKTFKNANIKFFASLWFCNEGLSSIGRLSLPVMVASWIGPVNLLVNTRASVTLYGGEHGVVAINMAHTLYTVITGLFVLSMANVLFPALSKQAALEDWESYSASLRGSIRGLLFLLLPMMFGLMALSEPLTALVFQGGRFQDTSVNITATALSFFSLGIAGFGLQVILSRACFALRDGRGPLLTGILAIAVNFILSYALAPTMEIAGPALASAIAVSTAAAGLSIRLHKKMPHGLWARDMAIDTVKMLVLALIMYTAVVFVMDFFAGNRILALLAPAGIGATIYMAGALILNLPEAGLRFSWVLGKLGFREKAP